MTVFGFGLPKGMVALLFCASAMSGCSAVVLEDPLAALRSAPETPAPAPASLQESDRSYAERSLQSALENSVSGKALVWTNPSSGARGSVTPLKTWKNDRGAYCRSYSEWIRPASGKSIRRRGVACRTENAIWKAA